MADTLRSRAVDPNKPVPMKLYASWEIDKSSPNCVPRQCSLKLTHIELRKAPESDLTSVFIAVKMTLGSQGSRRTLRSSEIPLGPDGLLEVDLDIQYSLQYQHYLKRDGNKLQLMVQRRKRYRNRTILGYKTLAIGFISMTQVLQCPLDKDLLLYPHTKNDSSEMGRVTIEGMTSQPVRSVANGRRKLMATNEADPSPDQESEDEEVPDDYSTNDEQELSDLEVAMEEERRRTRPRPPRGRRIAGQRNFKQKIVALLRRFKITEDEVMNSDQDVEPVDLDREPGDLDDLIDQLEDLSDSGPEMDTLSVMSTPKPRLRPYFGGSQESSHLLENTNKDTQATSPEEGFKSPNDSDSGEIVTDPECSDPTRDPDLDFKTLGKKISSLEKSTSFKEQRKKRVVKTTERRSSAGNIDYLPRKVLLDQLSSVLHSDDMQLPESFILVDASEGQGQLLSHRLQERNLKVVCTCSKADIKATVSFLVNKLQKFCNFNSKSPTPIKVAVVGSDAYISGILKPWVEQFSAKSPDWQQYVRFLVIPQGSCSVGKHLGTVDSVYSSCFCDSLWKESMEKTDISDNTEVVSRISRYVKTASHLYPIIIAEAMLNCRSKRNDEDSSQLFIPFINEVSIGLPGTDTSLSVEPEDSFGLSASPPGIETPPCSPGGPAATSSPSTGNLSLTAGGELTDLVVDYWTVNTPRQDSTDGKNKKDGNKTTLKAAFKSLVVSRLPCNGDAPSSSTLTMTVVTKEKKKINIRIGKKAKEIESKTQTVEGISRLICTSKSQNSPFTVMIDGLEWVGVKFFQLTPQWQTHIKQFPVLVFSCSETPSHP